MLPLEQTLETIKGFTDAFAERRDLAVRNSNPIVVEAASVIYNTINNMEKYGDIIEDEFKRKYTDEWDEMFQMDPEPQEVKVRNSGILDPTSGTVNTQSEMCMGYWFHPTRGLLLGGLKDIGFIPALYIGNLEIDCNPESLSYASEYYNKDKATLMIKLDNRFGGASPDGTPPTVLLSECIDCTNADEFMNKVLDFCDKFKKMIISLRDLSPVESIQIYETLKEQMTKLFTNLQNKTAMAKSIMQ